MMLFFTLKTSNFKGYGKIKRSRKLRAQVNDFLKCEQLLSLSTITDSLISKSASIWIFIGKCADFSVLKICLFQGGPPSPFDRLNGTRQAMKAVRFLIENIGENIDENGKI